MGALVCVVFVSPVVLMRGARLASRDLHHSLLKRVSLEVAERPLEDQAANTATQDVRAPELAPPAVRPSSGFPVYVMLPLDTVWLIDCDDGSQRAIIKREKAMDLGLSTLKTAGVEGIMVDVWWGIVEREQGVYDFSAYQRLFEKAREAGLKIQAVMSFHAAGGNVGDTCTIPLPKWVLDVGEEEPGIFYTDRQGVINRECLSLGCDEMPLFNGKTPLKLYRDFVAAFADTFGSMFGMLVFVVFFKHNHQLATGNTLQEVTIGLGPAGELRYPSYPEGDGRWRFPGVGEFQCYDRFMMADLRREAEALGQPEWGLTGPHDAGTYNSRAYETGFFCDGGSWTTEYGSFFLQWYSGALVRHAERVLAAVSEVLTKRGRPRRAIAMVGDDDEEDAGSFQQFRIEPAVKLGIKLAGVHWWFRTASHASELTAGYFNTRGRDGYDPILAVAARYNARVSFTCVEMRDCEHPDEAMCSPQGTCRPFEHTNGFHTRCAPTGLLRQVIDACNRSGVSLAGENALQRYDDYAFARIIESALGQNARAGNLEQLTFLRMGDLMWENFPAFHCFLKRLRTGGQV